MSEIEVVDLNPQLVMGMRKKGRYKDLIPSMLKQLFEHIMKFDQDACCGPPIFLCHEITKEDAERADREGSADVEVAVPVSRRIDETEDMKIYEISGGKFAKTVHKGPYEACEPTYSKLFAWIHENGKKISGPIREIYLNDPNEVGIENTITEIYAPIEDSGQPQQESTEQAQEQPQQPAQENLQSSP